MHGNPLFDWEGIAEVFRTRRVVMTVQGRPQTVIIRDNSMVMDEQGQEIGRIDPVTLELEIYDYGIIGTLVRSLTAGTGDAYQAIASGLGYASETSAGKFVDWLTGGPSVGLPISPANLLKDARYMGADGIAQNLRDAAPILQAQAPPDTLGEPSWEHLWNPRFWATRPARALPLNLALVIPAIAAGAAAGTIGGPPGLGAYGASVVRILASAGTARLLESGLEAGSVYDECRDKGLPPAECKIAADQVFRNDMAAGGVFDIVQFGLLFAPTPFRVFARLFSRGFITVANVAGRTVFTGLTEAGEEFVQEVIKRDALGEKIQWDAEMKLAVQLGAIFGTGMGGGSGVYQSIKGRTVTALPGDLRAQFETVLADQRGALGLGPPRPMEEVQAELRRVEATIAFSSLSQPDTLDDVSIPQLDVLMTRQAALEEELAQLYDPSDAPSDPSDVSDPSVAGTAVDEEFLGELRQEEAELTTELAEQGPRTSEQIQADLDLVLAAAVIRPSWAVGLTNQELLALASQEGLNPYVADWYDGVDTVVIQEAHQGVFKVPDTMTITDLRDQAQQLRTEQNASIQAEERSLDEIASDPRLQRIVRAVIEQIKIEELSKEIRPTNPVDQVVWERTLAKMKAEAPQVPQGEPANPAFGPEASQRRARIVESLSETMMEREGDAPSLGWTNVEGEFLIEVHPSLTTGEVWSAERLAQFGLEPSGIPRSRGNFYRLNEGQAEALVPAAPEEPTAAAAGGGRRRPPRPPTEEATVPEPSDDDVKHVMDRISLKEPRKSFLDKFRRGLHVAQVAFVNDLFALKKFTEVSQKGGTQLSIEENPYINGRLLRGITGKANMFLEQGTFGVEFHKVEDGKVVPNFTGESFDAILDDVKEAGPWQEFNAYMTARRSVELAGRDIETGIDPARAGRSIAKLEADNPSFPDLAERLFKFQDSLLVYAQESGLINEELLEKMRSLNASYVPFYRVFDETAAKGLMGKKLATITAPFKRIKGSEREIINPLESIVKNTYTIIDAAERNRVGIMMANLVNENPELSDVFQPIDRPTTRVAQVSAKDLGIEIEGMTEEEVEGVVDVWRPSFFVQGDEATVLVDGEKKYFKVDGDLRRALLSMDEETLGMMGKLLGGPTRTLRAGAVLTPAFMVKNFFRDTMNAYLFSNWGFLPGIDTMRGVASLLGRDADYQLYRMSGAERATMINMDRSYLRRSFLELAEGRGWKGYAKNFLEIPRAAGDAIEQVNRIGEFKAGLRRGAHPSEAAFSARNVNLDFASGGAANKAANRVVAFWNPTFLGWEQLVREMKENPVRTSTKMFLGITLPSILLYLANKDDPRWKDIPQWKKDLSWIIMTKDHIFHIPKPHVQAILFGSMPERFLEWLDTRDPDLMSDTLKNAAEAGAPGFLPTAILPFIENAANFNFFRGQPVVPASRERLTPEFQYTRFTSETAKKVSGIVRHIPVGFLNMNPAQVDNLIQGWTAGLGRIATSLVDVALKKTGVSPDIPQPSPTLADRPVIRALVVRTPIGSASEALNDFYDLLEEYEKNEGTLKKLLEEGNQKRFQEFSAEHPELLFFHDFEKDVFYSASARYLRRVGHILSDIRKKQDEIWNHKTMDGDSKRERLDSLDRVRTDISRQALDLFFGGDPAVIQVRLNEAADRLGDVQNETPVLSREPTDFFDMRNLSASYTVSLEAVPRDALEGEDDVPATAFAWYEKNESDDKQRVFPNTAIYLINADPEKGTTFEDYILQWQQLQKLKGEDRAQFLEDHPQAYLGNLTKTQQALLQKFHATTPREQMEMLRVDDRLTANPRINWLRDHPEDNARLALWGLARLYTQEASDELVRLKTDLDIPDDAIVPRTLPATDSLETHFSYLEASTAHGPQSWEARRILAADDDYRADFGYEDIETPIAALDLLIEDRPLYDEADLLRETLPSVPDEDAVEYQIGYQFAIKALEEANPDWVDNQRRIEALKEGTNDEPTPEPIASGWVERGRVVDQHGGGAAEAILWLIDNPDVHDWALENGKLSDDGSDWNEPVLRLTVAHRETDAEYAAIEGDGRAARLARLNFRKQNPKWAADQARKEVYAVDPETDGRVVQNHAIYSTMVDEHGASSAEVKIWRAKDKTGYNAWREGRPEGEALHIKPVDVARLPIWEIDVKYRKEDAAYNALPAKGDKRDIYLATHPKYRKDRRRRDAYQLEVAEESIEDYVSYYELPERGSRRDRFLSENRGFYNDVWLGTLENAAVDFDRIPAEQADVIYEKWTPQMEEYYEGISEKVRLLTGESQSRERDRLRRKLFFNNPGFFEDRLKYEAYLEQVPPDAVAGYVAYRTILYEGKPDGWERWYAKDRALLEHPEFYSFLLAEGMQPIDPDDVPSESFERAYNEDYIILRLQGGAANLEARDRYRGDHPQFDLEGVELGLWQPHRNRPTSGRQALGQAARQLSRSGRRSPEFLGVGGR